MAAVGPRCERRSGWGDMPFRRTAPAGVWLGDSMRVMVRYPAATDDALLGGSFEPLGGQNLIGAAGFGCLLRMGPHAFNFELAAERSARSARTRACAFAGTHRGGAARMADELLPVAGTSLCCATRESRLRHVITAAELLDIARDAEVRRPWKTCASLISHSRGPLPAGFADRNLKRLRTLSAGEN